MSTTTSASSGSSGSSSATGAADRSVLPLTILACLGAVVAWAAPQSIAVALPPPLRVAVLLVAVVVGARCSSRIGLEIRAHGGAHAVLLGVAIGLAFGACAALVDGTVFRHHVPPLQVANVVNLAAWQRLAVFMPLALVDELVYRLCLVSLLARSIGARWQSADGTPAEGAFWLAIVAVAIIYLLLHRGAVTAGGPLTPMLVLREIVLHVTAGSLWGRLFWRHGLVTAIVAHLSAHVTLQIGMTLVLR